ncbi:MAG: glycosyltransferase family 9 protein [Planctomycetes bacterium]|nr:glycosyltransferase family 9 protein [Planctomycetota bacterium]
MTTVLFVRLSAMGDLVQGLGAIQALHAVRPDWRLRVLTQSTFAPLLERLPFVAGVDTFDRRGGLRAAWTTIRALRRQPIDVAVDLQGNWKSALFTRCSGARERLGLRGAWRQEPASGVLLRRRLVAPGVPHPARAAMVLVQALAAEALESPPCLVAGVDEIERENHALRAIGVDAAQPFGVVVVTDPVDPRALRPEVVATLPRQAALPVVQLLGPAEAGVAPVPGLPILRHAPGELRRLVALGACGALAGGVAFGPDQGATHVLAAAGMRTKVWFGPQDPERTAPPRATVLLHPKGPACRPCRRSQCHHPEGPVCMAFSLDEAKSVPPPQ